MNSKTIPVFFTTDDAYIPFLAVALQSLIENSSKENEYIIRILYTDITKENREKINKYNKENIKIEFVDLNKYLETIKEKLHTRDYYSKTTYYRLFIAELYPQLDKAIYLDSDIVVRGDIAELFNIELEDNLIGGVTDGIIQSDEVFRNYVERVIGIAKSINYFNAGVLLMNLKELRNTKLQEKFLYLLKTVKYTLVQDEDYLNRICKGKVKIISKAWNTMPIEGDIYNRDDIRLIHYTLTFKPWHYNDVLYEEYFWNYANNTEYIEEIKSIKASFSKEKQEIDLRNADNLKKLALFETSCVGDDHYLR